MPAPNSRPSLRPKVNKKVVDFLDIGFGNAQKIATLSKRPRIKPKYFMGIDRERLATKTYSRQHNVKLMLGDATARLAKLPKESVKIINMIFFRLFQLKEILKCLE